MSRLKEIKKYYESRYGSGDLGMSSRSPESFRPFLEWLEIDPQGTILDVGCGSGSLLVYAEKISGIWGIDLSENAISIAKHNLARANLCVGDMQNLPYRSSIFCAITNIGGLEHVPNMERALDEMVRVCAVGGKLCIVVPNKDFLLYRILPIEGTKQSLMEEYLLNLKDWKKLFRGSGLIIKMIKSDPGPNLRTDFGVRIFLRGVVRKLIMFFVSILPSEYTYQFVFICEKS